MKQKSRQEIEKFVENQKMQLGLDAEEVQQLMDQTLQEEDDVDSDGAVASSPADAVVSRAPRPQRAKSKKRAKDGAMTDPYLSESQTIRARPTRVSRIRSFFYEHALPNEYIIQIGVKDVKPVLGGKFFKLGKRFLKFPAAVQTVYFTSDNANKNYQGLRIDGYACWRIDPEKPEIAARTLDFSDQDNPMGNTNRILRTICTEAIRHIIANIDIEDALTKKDEIGRNLKSQLERIERSWGVMFDQVGIERVTILSSMVFEDLQQKTRDSLRLTAAESRMDTDQQIEKKQAEHTKEMEALRNQTEKEARIMKATTESEIHKVEIDENAKREEEERRAEEARRKAEMEAQERAAEAKAERTKRQISRDAEVQTQQVETELKLTETKAQSELKKLEIAHRQHLREKEWAAEQKMKELEAKIDYDRSNLTADLEMAEEQNRHSLKEMREKSQLDHDIETHRLERLKTEEEIRNRISENRVMAELIEKLPDIAGAIEIDRYTVFDGAGSSPIVHSLSQILSILGEHELLGKKTKTH